ncbi:MAG: inositol monophosphatase [Saprospiraceae bacterium]|nr:inositol monophosphatase [Saprospiraceae bacterium]MCF8251089.1 inositol monophosphatase [Saprospiraceae bacterium]MCF8280374.1 inositol monophosphatase [Bacteroidales bacterium]MCF8312855.1 inositol monophosphatase [Saprospiraceae bacterium]MCF8441348.1 inositol monophosphatase [Saprospiraceae bacterium]
MNTNELELLCQQTCTLVTSVADFIRGEVGKVGAEKIETKSLNSLVSYVDKTAERKLVAGLSELLPGSTFLTEEETVEQAAGEFQWIIDPLDGTTNFLHQLPCFAVSVALRQHEEIVLGIVYEVNRRECFYAWKNGGAWMNGQQISTSATASLADSLVATGFPYRDFDTMHRYIEILQELMKNTRGLRRYGAAAVDLAYVACGRFDSFFEYGLAAWDVAAGVLLVQEAGGRVSDFDGGDDFVFGGRLLAAAPGVFEGMFGVVKNQA